MIYLDHNATTPVEPAVFEAMIPYLKHRYGNPASAHVPGRLVNSAIEEAKDCVHRLLGVSSELAIWTSGATEALNLVLKSYAFSAEGPANIACGATEHKAVLNTAEFLQKEIGIETRIAPVTANGQIDLQELQVLVDNNTLGVCVMAANNETGVINDVSSASKIAHRCGAHLICDATQVAGKLPLDIKQLGADVVTASAHKMYGPQGVGVLVAAPNSGPLHLTPLIHGGGQQRGARSGTLNVPGIVGFGAAAELGASSRLSREAERQARLRNHLEALLKACAGPITVHGADAPRLPNTTNLRIHGVDADALIANCPDVAFSSGSACSSAVPTPSHVLTAMGVPAQEAEESVRLSLGRSTTEADIEKAAELIGAAAARIRQMNA